MPKPQQPELRRSEQVPALAPDATEGKLEARDRPDITDPTGPVPPEQREGHVHDDVPDQPDPDAFAEKFGTKPPDGTTAGDGGSTDSAADASSRARTRKRVTAAGIISSIVFVVWFGRRRRRR